VANTHDQQALGQMEELFIAPEEKGKVRGITDAAFRRSQVLIGFSGPVSSRCHLAAIPYFCCYPLRRRITVFFIAILE
jgi:hypothetical protein